MFDLLANATVAGLSVVSARVLEQYNWFQRLAPETKRLIAVAIAAFKAFSFWRKAQNLKASKRHSQLRWRL